MDISPGFKNLLKLVSPQRVEEEEDRIREEIDKIHKRMQEIYDERLKLEEQESSLQNDFNFLLSLRARMENMGLYRGDR